MKILVTGGTGFIGSRLVKRLKNKDGVKEILVLSLNKKGEDGKITYLKGNITNPDTFEKIKSAGIVFHLASIINESVPLKKMRDVNVKGTENVLKYCRNNNTEQLIHISSTGVYGKLNNPPADEETPFNPQTNYERTKLEAENKVRDFMKDGFNATVLRPTIVYGENHYWKGILKKAKKRFPMIGKGANHFHTLYIKNIIDAFELILNNEKAYGKIYNIADERAYTYRETYEIMCNELGVEFPSKEIPPWMAHVIAKIYEIKAGLTIKKPTITGEYIDRLLRERWFDINKIKEELNYEPEYDFERGIREVIDGLGMKK
ncbi:MAG: NAD-dependent epimerase/dehydratase family protein [Candidatus Aenigmatarchaeota archaeon]